MTTIIQEKIAAAGHGALASPQYFAVHSTATLGATADNTYNYWRNNPNFAVHLVSDWNVAYHTVPYNRLCWQVGNGNATCEGLEICEATNRADFERGIEIAAQVVAERLAAHGWNINQVKPHKWFSETYGGSDHVDPYPYFTKWGLTFEQFLQKVQAHLTGTATPITTITGGNEDMPAKNDPIKYGGLDVTVEYALQDICNKLNGLSSRLGPVSSEYNFDYLPAILNNINGLYGIAGKGNPTALTGDQIDQLANSLKQGLSDELLNQLAARLTTKGN